MVHISVSPAITANLAASGAFVCFAQFRSSKIPASVANVMIAKRLGTETQKSLGRGEAAFITFYRSGEERTDFFVLIWEDRRTVA